MNIKEYIKLNGGATLDNNGNIKNIDQGYAVAIEGKETVIHIDDKHFNDVLSAYKTLCEANQNIGIWLDGDKVYFDISEVIEDLNTALVVGRNRSQLAIFDFSTKNVINC